VTTSPEISVIIASYNSRSTIGDCLRTLREQKTTVSFEVIVVDSSTDGTGELVAQNYPWVRLFCFKQRKFPGTARNIGVSQAGGRIIAFTDADCMVDVHWISEIRRAHDLPYLAISGAIGNANPWSYLGWGYYFCEFAGWSPGTAEGWLRDGAGANVSYKREALDRYGPLLNDSYCSDTVFHEQLLKAGHGLWFRPAMLVYHYNPDRFIPFIRHQYFHGRSLARVRRHRGGGFNWRGLVYIPAVAWVPLKRLAKIGRNCLFGGEYAKAFALSWPVILLGLVCWSLGEAAGYAGE
jgi:glycosyltransferase involved in cell wall biosynthesis